MDKMIRIFAVVVAVASLTLGFAGRVLAEDAAVVSVTLKDHKFEPATVEAPAGKDVVLEVVNSDDSVEEFESHGLKREKMIPAKSTVKIPLGTLKAGTYEFFGEFHEDSAKGTLVVK